MPEVAPPPLSSLCQRRRLSDTLRCRRSKISYLLHTVPSVLWYRCGVFPGCPDCRGPTPWQPSLKILSVFGTEGVAVALVVRPYRQKLDRMAPVLAFDPCVGRAVVQHLGLHPRRRDVRFSQYDRMRRRLLHEEVLVYLDIADFDPHIRTGPVQLLGGARRRPYLPPVVALLRACVEKSGTTGVLD